MSQYKKKPETLMMSLGYKPELSEGSVKCPVFQTSTFVFKKAEDGKRFFQLAYGLETKATNEEMGLIYTRLNNPNAEILENRISVWDEGDDTAVFGSGMAAISTTLLEFLNPGEVILSSAPVYGGTHHFIEKVLPKFNIHSFFFYPNQTEEEIWNAIEKNKLTEKIGVIYIETPANPTNDLIDIEMCSRLAKRIEAKRKKETVVAVDNTYLGPIWQHPLKHGADLVLYSATKYIGGHSDVVAGAVVGCEAHIGRIKTMRAFFGNGIAPWEGSLLMRSLETLKIRMEAQGENARKVAEFLKTHKKVEKVYYLGFITDENQKDIYNRQCKSPGAMISFNVNGGEKEAFVFLNHLKTIKLAVSLGGTESLAQHPASMTHIDIPDEEKKRYDITPKLVRISVGVEAAEDIIQDISQALDKI